VLAHARARFEGFEAYDVEPESLPDVFASRPVILFGKWRGERQGKLILDGITGSGPHRMTLDLTQAEPKDDNAALKYLWARSRIQTCPTTTSSIRRWAREGSHTARLHYSLLTQYTPSSPSTGLSVIPTRAT
jgi:Ca-activated chloride channel family protein